MDPENQNLSPAGITPAPGPAAPPVPEVPQLAQEPSAPPPATPTTPTPPVEPKSTSSQVLARLGLIFLILALLGLGGSLVKNYLASKKKVACTLEAKVCPDGTAVGRVPPKCEFVPCPSPTATLDVTANWETYTNVQYRYTLQYPSDWKIEERQVGEQFPQYQGSIFVNLSLKKSINQETDPLLSIYVFPETSANELLSGQNREQDITKERTIGGIEGIEYELPAMWESKWIFVNKDGKTYLFQESGDEDAVGKSDQILSTFKFLEATPSATPQ